MKTLTIKFVASIVKTRLFPYASVLLLAFMIHAGNSSNVRTGSLSSSNVSAVQQAEQESEPVQGTGSEDGELPALIPDGGTDAVELGYQLLSDVVQVRREWFFNEAQRSGNPDKYLDDQFIAHKSFLRTEQQLRGVFLGDSQSIAPARDRIIDLIAIMEAMNMMQNGRIPKGLGVRTVDFLQASDDLEAQIIEQRPELAPAYPSVQEPVQQVLMGKPQIVQGGM